MTTTTQATSAEPKQAKQAKDKYAAFHEEERLGKAYDTTLLRRLWPFVRPHAKYIGISLATLAVLTSLNLVRPILMGDVVKQASEARSELLLRDGVLLAVLLLTTQALTFAQMYAMQIAGARSMADLREHVFKFLQGLELRFFDRTPVGRLVTRATSDVDAVSELFSSGVLNAMGDLVSLVGIVAMMLILDVRLSLIAFAALPIVMLVTNFVRKRSREAYRDIRTRTARLNAFLNEQVSGIAVVQAYARERAMAEEFDGINDAYRDANQRAILYEAILDAAIEMVGTVCIASILWWAGIKQMSHQAVTFPLIVTFTQYIKQFFEPVSLLAQRYTILQAAMAGAERIFQLLDQPHLDAPKRADAASLPKGPETEAIAFSEVTFGYKPNVPVLQGVSFLVNRCEKVALVGATGAGKTTVASLALRLYELEEGSVRVFGTDVRALDRHALRHQFSVVPQDVFLFSGTVFSNVAVGADHPDRKRVEDALARVGALDLFLQRPGGLDAVVEERGSNFSAGERQLIAFARAVYRDAPIVILDEATASIDSETEARLQRALTEVMVGRTALVIAHRLSTIRSVDKILVFHKGRLVEAGPHEELLQRGGVYARLYRMQLSQERLAQVTQANA